MTSKDILFAPFDSPTLTRYSPLRIISIIEFPRAYAPRPVGLTIIFLVISQHHDINSHSFERLIPLLSRLLLVKRPHFSVVKVINETPARWFYEYATEPVQRL